MKSKPLRLGVVTVGLLACSRLEAQSLFAPGSTVGSTTNGTSHVGIGTSAPSRALTVAGDVLFSDTIRGGLLQSDSGVGGRAFLVLDKNAQNGIATGGDYVYLAQEANQGILTSAYNTPLVLGSGVGSMTISPEGSVGVGVSQPAAKLHVQGANTYVGTVVADVASVGYSSFGLFESGVYRASMYWHPSVPGVGFYGASTWFFESGNVGIGTASPNNFQGWARVLDVHGGSNAKILATEGTGNVKTGIFSHATWRQGGVGKVGTESHHPLVLMAGYGNDQVTILPSGNVGIGTANPTHTLAVNGTGKFKEVIVETTGWSDYVFAPDYELQSLSEVEAHIKEHQHLPGIPSANEVAENGVSLGEMQAKLLAKIEELTLHLIAQEKRTIAVEKENAELRHEVLALRSAQAASTTDGHEF